MLIAAAKEDIALPLAALRLSRNLHQGHQLPTSLLYSGIGFAISNTATGLARSLYDDGRRSRSTGKERDSESGLDYFGARFYGSALGRFTSPDKPLIGQDEHDPQSWNLYSYARNNPLLFTDPDGENYFVCVSNGNGGANCQTYSDDAYAKLYGQQNGQQGINLPGHFQSGDITCGGSVCGSSYYYTTSDAQDETFSIGLGIGVGKAVGAVAGRALGFVGGLFGRTATTTAVEAGTELLAGKVLNGFSAAEEQMIQKSLSALEAAGYNTGKLQTFIRITDAPPGYAGMSLGDGAALGDGAFSSQAMLNHTIEHELIHMEQTAQGLRTAYGPGTAQSLEEGADSQAKFPAPNQ